MRLRSCFSVLLSTKFLLVIEKKWDKIFVELVTRTKNFAKWKVKQILQVYAVCRPGPNQIIR